MRKESIIVHKIRIEREKGREQRYLLLCEMGGQRSRLKGRVKEETQRVKKVREVNVSCRAQNNNRFDN